MIVVHIHGLDELPNHHLLEVFVVRVTMPDVFEVPYHGLPIIVLDGDLFDGNQALILPLLFLKLVHALLDLVPGDAHLNGMDQIRDLLLDLPEAALIIGQLRLLLETPGCLHDRVRDPLHGIIIKDGVLDRPNHLYFDIVLPDVFFIAGMSGSPGLAGVVEVLTSYVAAT